MNKIEFKICENPKCNKKFKPVPQSRREFCGGKECTKQRNTQHVADSRARRFLPRKPRTRIQIHFDSSIGENLLKEYPYLKLYFGKNVEISIRELRKKISKKKKP